MTKDNIDFLGILLPFIGSLIGCGIMILLNQRSHKIAQKKLKVEIDKLKQSQLDKVFDFAKESLIHKDVDKKDFLKKLNVIIQEIDDAVEHPYQFEDGSYYDIIATHVLRNLDKYEESINGLINEYPHVFSEHISSLKSVSKNIKTLKYVIDTENLSISEPEEVLADYASDLMNVFDDLKLIYNNVYQEYNVFEVFAKKYIGKYTKE